MIHMPQLALVVAAVFALGAGCSSAQSSEDAVPATSQAGPADSVESRFVGNWELVSFESFRENGEIVDNDYVGRLVYDEHGNMSGVGMPRTLVARAASRAAGASAARCASTGCTTTTLACCSA